VVFDHVLSLGSASSSPARSLSRKDDVVEVGATGGSDRAVTARQHVDEHSVLMPAQPLIAASEER
jgi:hypothetical protein